MTARKCLDAGKLDNVENLHAGTIRIVRNVIVDFMARTHCDGAQPAAIAGTFAGNATTIEFARVSQANNGFRVLCVAVEQIFLLFMNFLVPCLGDAEIPLGQAACLRFQE